MKYQNILKVCLMVMTLLVGTAIAAAHTLKVKARPDIACTFNKDSVQLEYGNTVSLSAYTQTGFKFLRWEDETGNVVSVESYFQYTMPGRDVTLYAVCEYNPENPGNPNTNNFDAATGTVVIDDFKPGSLRSAISSLLSRVNASSSDVLSIIVAGEMNMSDQGILNYYTNCAVLDLSRTWGYEEITSYAFDNSTALQSVILPAGITQIGYEAFYRCSSLREVTCFAMTPPVVGSYAFYGIAEDAVLYVPSAVIPLYAEADVWKDFTVILPVQENVRTLTVSFPAGTDMNDYANLWLELTNTGSGQRMHYVIDNHDAYTFVNLITDTQWNITLRNERGDIFGRINKVDIKDSDVNVQFTGLSKPKNISLSVLSANGEDVTAETQVVWTDASGNYVGQSHQLSGLPSSAIYSYSISLSQDLAMQYVSPEAVTYTVSAYDNAISYNLKTLPNIQVSGSVRNSETNLVLRGCGVTATQTYGGQYKKTYVTQTDNEGNYTLSIPNVPTTLSFSNPDYISQSIVCDDMMTGVSSVNIPTMKLSPISGTVVSLDFSYTPSVVEGETAEKQNGYSDYSNVTYSVYNQTQGCEITDLVAQYPQLVLLSEVTEGDVLKITASSLTNRFMPVSVLATVDSLHQANATFPITELGKIHAHFVNTNNTSVIGALYDHNYKLVRNATYDNAEITFSNLQDGSYILVTMGESDLYGSVHDLNQLMDAGLTKWDDYVMNGVYVNSGTITNIEIPNVPVLDESKFYYTGSNTTFSANKTNVVVGNYITLTSYLDFKPEYASKINDLMLVVDMPESCNFVENSVMVGNSAGTYMLSGNKLSIPLSSYSDRVRFCIIPTDGGNCAPSAKIQFDMEGTTISQPIGAAEFTAQNLSLTVPATTTTATVRISGSAQASSEVEIYDEDILIGKTTALASGMWTASCQLNRAYNLSTHSIHATATTPAGVTLHTETKECKVNVDANYAQSVTMSHYNEYTRKQETVVFDLVNMATSPGTYSFYHEANFSFVVNFKDNSPERLTNVVVYVWDDNGNRVTLPATYNPGSDRWVASRKFSSSNLPTNADVDYDIINTPVRFDQQAIYDEIDDLYANIGNAKDDYLYLQSIADEDYSDYLKEDLHETLEALLADTLSDFELIKSYIGQLVDTTLNVSYDDEALDAYIDQLENAEDFNYDAYIDSLYSLFLIDDEILDYPDCLPEEDILETISSELGDLLYSTSHIANINKDELLSQGFQLLQTVDAQDIYYKMDDADIIIIDAKNGKQFKKSIRDFSASSSPARAAFRAKGVINMDDFINWGESFSSCISTLADLIGAWDKSNTSIQRLNSGLKALFESAECAYVAARTSLENELAKKYNPLITDAEKELNKIQKAEKEIITRINDNIKKTDKLRNLNTAHNNEINRLNTLLLDPSISESTRRSYQAQIRDLNGKILLNKISIQQNSILLSKDSKALKSVRKIIVNITNVVKNLKKIKEACLKPLQYLPKNFVTFKLGEKFGKIGAGLGKYISVAGKLAGIIGVPIELLDFGSLLDDCIKETDGWISLISIMESKLPCENDHEAAVQLYNKILNSAKELTKYMNSIILTQGGALLIDCATVAASFNPAVFLISGACNAYAANAKYFIIDGRYLTQRTNYWIDMGNLKCFCKCDINGNGCTCPKGTCQCPRCKKCKCKTGGPCTCGSDCKCHPRPPKVRPILDPSGFVYEGVFSNRLEGVTTTAFYKEEVEDMYGDIHEEIVKWDAEAYAQKNPLFTDENGYYNWDVPQGMWQVKYEKEGYETAFSEWLPVPPPQLEVNIAMCQNIQPSVKKAHAFEQAVEVEFDKYMIPDYLTTDNIIVMQNGSPVEGTIKLLNEDSPYKDETTTYASKLRFNAAAPFVADEVTLLVSNQVESYAGIQMADNFMQTFTIEPEVTEIVCDQKLILDQSGSATVEVSVLPAQAAAGKLLHIFNASQMILDIEAETVELDNNGKATIQVSGLLPGSTGIIYSVEGYDLVAMTLVDVVGNEYKNVAAPTASIASGATVFEGMSVTLSCATPNATIYYTLDGSCPCDEDTRLEYTGSIVINRDMTIKAMAIVPGGYESDIVEFVYYASGIENVFADDANVRVYPSPVKDRLNISANGKTIKSVSITNMGGVPVLIENASTDHLSIDVSALTNGFYVVEVITESGSYKQFVIKD